MANSELTQLVDAQPLRSTRPEADVYAVDSLLFSEEYSDFEVIGRGFEIKFHRSVICPQSAYFKALCSGNFKEKKGAELTDCCPLDILRVLAWMYYRQGMRAKALLNDFHLVLSTDEYSSLSSRASIENEWLDVVQSYMAADRFMVESFKRACILEIRIMPLRTEGLDSFVEAVRLAYGSPSPQEIRDELVCCVHTWQRGQLMGLSDASWEDLEGIFEAYPEFARRILMRCHQPTGMRLFPCSLCGHASDFFQCPCGDVHACGGFCLNVKHTDLKCNICLQERAVSSRLTPDPI